MRRLVLVSIFCVAGCSKDPKAVEPTFDGDVVDRDSNIDSDSSWDMRLRDMMADLIDGDADDARRDDGDSDAEMGGHGDGAIFPRWVLQNAAGDTLHAMVAPAPPARASIANLPQSHSIPPPAVECVRVTHRDGEPWVGDYSLATGTMQGCVGELSNSVYSDSGCSLPVVVTTQGGVTIGSRNGQIYYGSQRVAPGTTLYQGNTCAAFPVTADENFAFYTTEVVPASHRTAFAADAPLTLVAMY